MALKIYFLLFFIFFGFCLACHCVISRITLFSFIINLQSIFACTTERMLEFLFLGSSSMFKRNFNGIFDLFISLRSYALSTVGFALGNFQVWHQWLLLNSYHRWEFEPKKKRKKRRFRLFPTLWMFLFHSSRDSYSSVFNIFETVENKQVECSSFNMYFVILFVMSLPVHFFFFYFSSSSSLFRFLFVISF